MHDHGSAALAAARWAAARTAGATTRARRVLDGSCRRLTRARLATTFALALACGLGLARAEAPNKNEELRALRARIEALQRSLNETREQRDAAREAVHAIERQIGTLAAQLKRLDAELAHNAATTTELERRARDAQRRLRGELAALERQVHAAYLLGRQEQLKLLLNQQEPAKVARVLTYHRFLSEARASEIRAIEGALTELAALHEQIEEQNRALTTLRERQERNRSELAHAHAQRRELLARLEHRLEDQAQEIGRLRADEERLQRLIQGLKAVLPTPPAVGGRDARFGQWKGRLKLPLSGRIVAQFNDLKNVGDLRWRGVFLAGRDGEAVKAVFRGRVAYADWLRGFGLLLILDHGDGYMTLYGHNQSLHKEVGDWVESGETIAAVGSTGGAPASGVYFEIRENGEPRDPLAWCRAAGPRVSTRR